MSLGRHHCSRLRIIMLLVVVILVTLSFGQISEKRVSFEINQVCGENPKEPIALTGYQTGDFAVGTQLWTCPEDIKKQAEALELGNTTALQLLVKQGAQLESVNKQGHNNLLLASWGGHVQTVKYLLQEGANVRSKSHSGHTALHAAAQVGSTETAAVLVEHGANVNVRTNDGRTAFYLACLFGHLDTAQFLLKQGADPMIRDKSKSLALHGVSSAGFLPVIKYLHEEVGMSLNDATVFKSTPLILASSNGCFECVQYLVEQGANLQAKDKRGRNSLYMAAAAGHLDIVDHLLSSGLTVQDSVDHRGQTPLLVAVIGGNLSLVKLLLPLSFDHLNQVSSFGQITPLKMAASDGNLPIVKVLLDTGADVNLAYPLHAAISNSHTATALHLIDHEAKIEGDPNKKVLPCLHLAAKSGNTMIIERLIVLGAQVNQISFQKGETPIFFAAKRGHFRAVKALMRNGADPLMRNSEGTNILFYAIPYPKILAFLLNRSTLDVNEISPLLNATPVALSVEVDALDTLKYLLTHTKANVNHMKGKIPLIESASVDNPAFLQTLLEYGANANVTDSSGWTALHFASSNGFLSHVQTLLDHRADVNARNDDGSTPLLLAASQGQIDVVKVLIARGANLNPAEKTANTPLYKAARNGHLGVVKYLSERLDSGNDSKFAAIKAAKK
ncbi:hypothetical protein TCAL_02993, partial [Tigriopus californicus]|eukprot:TCALIF_02993-PA protein Name:"Similar to ANKRD50 Ankyrin repeat domain-containing protein 50 (Homo sapiens)" AED:0.07 eAED:0.07 QI:55/0.5/0.66/1/0.5/0.33/3/0/673